MLDSQSSRTSLPCLLAGAAYSRSSFMHVCSRLPHVSQCSVATWSQVQRRLDQEAQQPNWAFVRQRGTWLSRLLRCCVDGSNFGFIQVAFSVIWEPLILTQVNAARRFVVLSRKQLCLWNAKLVACFAKSRVQFFSAMFFSAVTDKSNERQVS